MFGTAYEGQEGAAEAAGGAQNWADQLASS